MNNQFAQQRPLAGCGLFLLIIIITCIVAVFGCTSTKNIDTASEIKKEIKVLNVDSIIKRNVDSVKRKYEELIKTLDADIVFNNNCDTTYIDTGSVKVISTIKYIPGKGFEATGNISRFKLRESELLKSLDEATIRAESETNLRIQAQRELQEEKIIKNIKKKSKFFSFWWLLIIAYLLGWKFPLPNLIPIIKKLKL